MIGVKMLVKWNAEPGENDRSELAFQIFEEILLDPLRETLHDNKITNTIKSQQGNIGKM